MILLIDNYDSFAYNLYQLAASVYKDIQVVRNDELTLQEIQDLNPEAFILSPGPGRPEQAGICMDVIQSFYTTKPILGICLGHQAIAAALKGEVGYAKELVHGKAKNIQVIKSSSILKNLTSFKAARYHSLAVTKMPEDFEAVALCDEEIMAIAHKKYPVFGLQFHPESIMSDMGQAIMKNFMQTVKEHNYDSASYF